MAAKTAQQSARIGSAIGAEQFLVDLSPEPVKAKVVREGYQVPAVALDSAKAAFFIDTLTPIGIQAEPRVVVQSVAAGTKVLPGTSIDLVLARSGDIPINILDKPHRDFANKTVADLNNTLLADNAARQIVLKYDTPDLVPAAEKASLTAELAKNGVSVNEANADTGFAAAFNTARYALAFR